VRTPAGAFCIFRFDFLFIFLFIAFFLVLVYWVGERFIGSVGNLLGRWMVC